PTSRPTRAPLFPYTTLFRSVRCCGWNSKARLISLNRLQHLKTRYLLRQRSPSLHEIEAMYRTITDNQEFLKLLLGGVRPWCQAIDRKSTRLNSSHVKISYAV